MNNGMILWILLLILYSKAEDVFPLKYLALMQAAIHAHSLSENDLDNCFDKLPNQTMQSIARFIAISYPDFDLALLHCDNNACSLDASILQPMRELLKHYTKAKPTIITITKTITEICNPTDPSTFIRSFACAELWGSSKTVPIIFNLNDELSQNSPENVLYELIALRETEYSYEEHVCITHQVPIPFGLFDVLETDFSRVLTWVERIPNFDGSLNSSIKRLRHYCRKYKRITKSECWTIM